MTIENTLERIAVALERLADAKHTETFLKPPVEVVLPASTDEIAATMAVVAKAAVATEAKRRGRPPKAPEAPAPPAENPVAEPAAPDEKPAPVEVTKDALRAALVAYQGLCGNDPKPARAIMATHGGADVLAKVPVERYAVVLQAVNDAAAKLKT